MTNPFFEPLPDNGLPSFDRIETHHYRDAFDQGIEQQRKEIASIRDNRETPDFENSIEALERSGALLRRVGDVFWNLTSSDTSDEIQALELEMSARLAAHNSRIYSDTALYERLQTVADSKPVLDGEQQQLMNENLNRFVRAGAQLEETDRNRVSEITERLANLTTQFGQNVLKDTNAFQLILDEGDDVAGLPEFVLNAARAEAEQNGLTDKYVFTISRSSITPLLQYADNREIRQKMYEAYTDCGMSSVDNRPIIREIVALRTERARLMGYASHADFMLDDRMAKNPAAVRELLDQIWRPAQQKVSVEAEDLQTLIQEDGGNFSLAPWDWWYYTEKLRKRRFDLDEEEVKPYFPLNQVRDGAFEVARRLYGITFSRCDVPVYHPDVEAYEVTDADGSLIGLFLFDFFMRPSKRGGAWMSAFREQSAMDRHETPVIVNCCNFPKSEPCLLGMDEVRTLFHEFGHGLHGLLSRVRYRSLSGTSVKQDFVELPSQIMEHWAMEPEVLDFYARHHETGEGIPTELIDKLHASETFNQGFATTEYLAACYLDLAWHGPFPDSESSSKNKDASIDVAAFERKAMEDIHKIQMVDPRYWSSYFLHIFSGDHYSAGYYVYIWAEVLDADGFEAFKENGIFDEATASAFRKHVLEAGGSVEPMEAYRNFRGREPSVEPLLRKRGLA